MARIKEGILGGVEGKAGKVIGYYRRGVPVIRSIPRKSTKPRSEAQLAQVNKMRVLSPFLNRISTYIAIGFELEARGQSATPDNKAKSYNLKHAIKGTYPDQEIDYSELRLSSGPVPLPKDIKVKVDGEGLLFTWGIKEETGWPRNTDKVMIMAYVPEKEISFQIIGGATVDEGKEFLKIGKFKNPVVIETYVSFITQDHKSISNSFYAGQVIF